MLFIWKGNEKTSDHWNDKKNNYQNKLKNKDKNWSSLEAA